MQGPCSSDGGGDTQPVVLIVLAILTPVAEHWRSNLGRDKWELSDIPAVLVLLAESRGCGCPYHGLLWWEGARSGSVGQDSKSLVLTMGEKFMRPKRKSQRLVLRVLKSLAQQL